MADEKQENEVVYVKLGRRGLIERTASTAREQVNMQGTGWVRKDSPNAPSADAIAEVEKRVKAEDETRVGRISPTSAVAAAANPDVVNAVPGETGQAKSSVKSKPASGTSASAKADAAA